MTMHRRLALASTLALAAAAPAAAEGFYLGFTTIGGASTSTAPVESFDCIEFCIGRAAPSTVTSEGEGVMAGIRLGYTTEVGGILLGGEFATYSGSIESDGGIDLRAGPSPVAGPTLTDLQELRAIAGLAVGGGFTVFGSLGLSQGTITPNTGLIKLGPSLLPTETVQGYSFGVGLGYQITDTVMITLEASRTVLEGSIDGGATVTRADVYEPEAIDVDIEFDRLGVGLVISF